MTSNTAVRSRIRLNVRGLAELCLLAVLATAVTVVTWWAVGGGGAAGGPASAPIWRVVLLRPEIVASLALAEFILLMALLLSVAPPKWWLRVDAIEGQPPTPPETPLRWLGEQLHNVVHPPAPPAPGHAPMPGQEGMVYPMPGDPYALAGQPGYGPPVPGQPAPGQPVPGQSAPGQPAPGQPMPGQPVYGPPVPGQSAPQPGAPEQSPANGVVPPFPQVAPPPPPAPGEQQPAPAQPAPAEQQAAAPAAPLSSVLQFEEITAEDDPLADLGDIKDILNSAFDEDASIDPDREALGKSLDAVEIKELLAMTRQVHARFKQPLMEPALLA